MTIHADFYVGRGADAEWLGSIAMDGDPTGIGHDGRRRPPDATQVPLLQAATEDEYRARVADLLAARPDATVPTWGWPWPWADSRLSDFAYAFADGRVMASCFGHAWFDPRAWHDGDDEAVMAGPKVAQFPDMTERMRVTFGPRSGLILMTSMGPPTADDRVGERGT